MIPTVYILKCFPRKFVVDWRFMIKLKGQRKKFMNNTEVFFHHTKSLPSNWSGLEFDFFVSFIFRGISSIKSAWIVRNWFFYIVKFKMISLLILKRIKCCPLPNFFCFFISIENSFIKKKWLLFLEKMIENALRQIERFSFI